VGTPLYVHLPFCAAKCHYCDFFSVAAEGHDRGALIDAILREAHARAPWHPRTVYFGGGTPSLLSIPELERLLDGLHGSTGFRDSAVEVTAECNPESLDEAKARALLGLGVNRLSIGFQSLSDEVLQLFGRVHSVADSFAAFAAARAAGAQNVNVDLIFAVPGQTLDPWIADLNRVLDLGPNHLSAYNLTFEEETLFRRWLDEGRLAKQPEELELALFEATREIAASRGYHAYEISNFASHGRQCDHNVNYWRNGPYLGLGPSAVSKVGWKRSGNIKGVASYRARIDETRSAHVWDETLEPRERLAETWWLGLRLAEGLDPADARERAGCSSEDDGSLEVAESLLRDGLLDREKGRYRLSERGLPLGDFVARKFLQAPRAGSRAS
jgi:oxygen-independent coproporphyrinogen-3 oxidase